MDKIEAQNIAEGVVAVHSANNNLDEAVTDLVNLHNINRTAALIAILAVDYFVNKLDK